MGVTGLYFMLMTLILLGEQIKNSDAAFHIVTDRLQYFQYDPVSFQCEGLDGSMQAKDVRIIFNKENKTLCEIKKTSTGFSCTIDTVYPGDSGEYLCEAEGGMRSNSLNITITTSSVILKSPIVPLMEGVNVTLRCITKSSSVLAADFYKDGVLVGKGSLGEVTIYDVSKFDEGLYKCSIPEAGESPQSWLTVRAVSVFLECPVLPVNKGDNVTLQCSKNSTSSKHIAQFYKDGYYMGKSSTGEMTIDGVSKSDEGLYKCGFFGGGESPESWLAVRASCRETCELPHDSWIMDLVLMLRTVFTIVMVALLLLLVGLIHCVKFKVT